MTFQHIAAEAARALLEQGATAVDIRDPGAFAAGHLPGAQRLDNDNVGDFIASAERQRPLLVYCYHGISSQGAARFLAEQGFSEVYSLDGGFEAWRSAFPAD